MDSKQSLIMKKVFYGLLAFFILQFVYCHFIGNCCWTDYSRLIKKVADPMEKNIVLFYQKHLRHPTFEETPKLLEKSGCTQIKKLSHRDIGVGLETLYSCIYSGNKILIRTDINSGGGFYGLRFEKGNTGCSFSLNKNGRSSSVGCGQKFCLNMPRG